MRAQACKGKAKIAVLVHELLSLDLNLPTSSVRAAQALQLQREALVTNARRKAQRTAWSATSVGDESYGKRTRGWMAAGLVRGSGSGHFSSRLYSASAAVALDTQDSHNVDYTTTLPPNDNSIRYHTQSISGGYRSSKSLDARQWAGVASDKNLLERLTYAIRCLNAPSNTRTTPLTVARLFFELPDHAKVALPMRQLRRIFRAITQAVLASRETAVNAELREGLRGLPIQLFLDRFSDSSINDSQLDPDNVDALLLIWLKALLHAHLPDLAGRVYESASSRGYLSSRKLDIDAVVGPLVDLQEWGLILKWTQGRVCSAGVHAMRMRAFSSLGTPQLAVADYEEHQDELQTETPAMIEAMKAYYMTRNFARAASIHREISRQGRTRNHQYIASMTAVVDYLGFTPLLEKDILDDIRLVGASHHHVPLLNILVKRRVENRLSILSVIECYPRASTSINTKTVDQPSILLDQRTLALILDDTRSFPDVTHLRTMWQDILCGLPENKIDSNLLGALIRSLLRLDLSEEALHLLQDLRMRNSNTWIDRPADIDTNVFNPLIGYMARKDGVDAVGSVLDLMQASGCRPNRKTISSLVDGLAQHELLKPSVRTDLQQSITRLLPPQLRAGLMARELEHGALRNHNMQEEIVSSLGDPFEKDIAESSTVFEWADLGKRVKLVKPDNVKPQKGFPASNWSGTGSPAPTTIFAAAVDKGFPLDIAICTAILRMYLSKGYVDRAQEIILLSWQRGISPSVEMWSAFVTGLGAANQMESLGRRIDVLVRDASSSGVNLAQEARSMAFATLLPDQATWTRIIEELINSGAFRHACQVVKCVLSLASRVGETPDVGLLAVSFEALIRARLTIKAGTLLRDPPFGYGTTLRAAKGTARVVLLRSLRRARAWHSKHGDPELVTNIDAFLKSMPGKSSTEQQLEKDGKHVKRKAPTSGELKELEEQIGRMFNRLWPDQQHQGEEHQQQSL